MEVDRIHTSPKQKNVGLHEAFWSLQKSLLVWFKGTSAALQTEDQMHDGT